MASLEEIRQIRLEKKNKLEEKGFNPYSSDVDFSHSLKNVIEEFEEGLEVRLVGRIMSLRGQGSLLFFNFFDGTETFQGVLKKDVIGDDDFNFFEETVDIGDFIEVGGKLFTTQRGQQSVEILDWKITTKSLRPLPEKYHGLQDVEQKYRKRYLDVLMDKDAYNTFKIRAKIISKIREILDNEDFMEVETPILQNQASGAMAETFKTHHDDYDIDMVLRISLEAELKMLMVGGYPAIYEIGKNFRNEGSDSSHMQEFTMLEWYKAYKNLDYNFELTERMIKTIAKEVLGKMQFKIIDANDKEIEIDLESEWKKIKFNDLIKENTGWNPEGASRDEIEENASKLGFDKDEISKISDGNLLDFIFKKSSRNKIINPTFVTHYPGALKPLAVQNEDGTAEVAQLIIAGAEITNQYAELIDPVIQKGLLEKQSELKEKGDKETMELNNEFIEAMEYGMPTMTGFGMGIDRLVAILTEKSNLRDTVFFPIMRSIDQNNKSGKSKETKIVVAVLNKSFGLENWEELNTIAHLGASFAAREGKDLFLQNLVETKDGEDLELNIQHAIMIKMSEENDSIKQLIKDARKNDLKVSIFTREMKDTTNDKKVIKEIKAKDFNKLDYLGVLVFGEKSLVEDITKDFALYK
ncbi:MAG: lysine--tRNA ligase [Candidatus Pacebacteria bacterium]|nr:lysine--tRNA ligase [Candidatus Paceibacterota bacterium]